MLDAQRRKWADEWEYFGNLPVAFSPKLAEVAIEAEIWANWILLEDFKMESKYARVASPEAVKYMIREAKGSSGVELQYVAQRLRQLGVIELNADYEAARRATADLVPAEIHDIYGEVDTTAEMDSVQNWAKNRVPQILSRPLGKVKRPIKDLDETDIPNAVN